jgi:cyanophycinase
MTKQPKGKLIIIGGHEDKGKDEDREILEFVAEEVKRLKGSLVLMTVASYLPEELIKEYTEVFNELGIERVETIDVRVREDGYNQGNIDKIEKNSIIFFTGGDQLRITSQIGDSPTYQCLQERYEDGCTIVGTSAGAAAMPETMLISGDGDDSFEIDTLGMAPGLGLLPGVVIDSHFAERGRMGRLIGAVAQNPRNLGLGIDEDTAIIVHNEQRFEVIGSGAVYVVDGTEVGYSSLSEKHAHGILTIHNLKLHVLGKSQQFDLVNRKPIEPSAEELEQEEEAEQKQEAQRANK